MALAARVYATPPQRKPLRAGARGRRVRLRATAAGLRVGVIVAVAVGLILAYVWLTAELTAQTYRLHDAQKRQTALLQRYNDLHQQVAHLESLPVLEAAAAKLHMTVPATVSLIPMPQAARAQHPMTLFAASLAGLKRWLNVP